MATRSKSSSSNRDILDEARKRFERVQAYESVARDHFVEDMKFAYGDSYNGYQWPSSLQHQYSGQPGRTGTQRPMLTVNKTQQHCLQIINDARQNKPGIAVKAVSGDASVQSAEVFEGIVRHIEYISNAQAAYDTATWQQVIGGIGYWRVLTDYADDEGFDQEIFIRRVADPLSVYLDPDIEQYDGSDARFGFVFRDMTRDEFDDAYPRYKDRVSQEAILGETGGWCDDDHVRVVEYYRKVAKKSDQLLRIATDNGSEVLRGGDMPPDLRSAMPNDRIEDTRELTEYEIEWYLLAGSSVLEKRIWPGKYIPLVRCVGQETLIDGKMDRRGHTRALLDPQRMYNYWTSAATEFVALQGKSPWVAPAEAIEGYETYWETANVVNYSVLPFKHLNDSGQPIPPPSRPPPPTMPQAYLQGLQMAQQEMMLVTGQYQAIMGAPSNETSGKAINARQRQGDNATYHFIDHQAQAIRYTGRILIDLIPKVYDTDRVMKIMAEDGEQSEVLVSPNAPQALQSQKNPLTGVVQRIFNPSVGRYEVEADIGPSFGTKRQEAFNAFSQIMSQNSQLGMLLGDFWMKNSDFPGAEEAAERLRNMLPPQATGGPSPQMQALHAAAQKSMQDASEQMAKLQELNAKLSEQLTKANLQLEQAKGNQSGRSAKDDLAIYDAETRRMAAVGNIDPEALRPIIRELVSQALETPIVPVMALHAAADQARQPPPPPMTNGSGDGGGDV